MIGNVSAAAHASPNAQMAPPPAAGITVASARLRWVEYILLVILAGLFLFRSPFSGLLLSQKAMASSGRRRRGTDRLRGRVGLPLWTSAWEADSKSLIYATDCGRGLEMTALVHIEGSGFSSAAFLGWGLK